MTSTSKSNRRLINSVQKALDILDLFNMNVTELGTTEIARSLGMSKSTVAGLVYTLEANRYLEQNPDNRKYRLGLKLAERGGTRLNQINLRQVARPYLEELQSWCNESVNLAIRDGDKVIYIERLFGSNALGMRSEIGKREPIHSTALGKAILSHLPKGERQAFIAHTELFPITPKTITDKDQFAQELAKTLQRGYSIDNEENELGGRCLAAPIINFDQRPIAALSVSVPLQRLPDSKIPPLGRRVQETAERISLALGLSTDNLE